MSVQEKNLQQLRTQWGIHIRPGMALAAVYVTISDWIINFAHKKSITKGGGEICRGFLTRRISVMETDWRETYQE